MHGTDDTDLPLVVNKDDKPLSENNVATTKQLEIENEKTDDVVKSNNDVEVEELEAVPE